MSVTFTGFVILRANKDILYFDAVTKMSESYSTSISKHPLSNGSFITDHSTRENPRYSLSGILTDADFNINRPSNLGAIPAFSFDTGNNVSTGANGLYKPTEKQFTNNTYTVTPVEITENSSINKIFPEVVAQFTKDTIPEVLVTPQSKAKTAIAVKRELIAMWNNREQFQVLDMLDNLVIQSYGPCVFTNVGFEETVDTGEGIYPDLQFEEVAYSEIRTVSVKIQNKGRKNGKSTSKKGQVDPATAPASYTKASVLDYTSPSN